MPRNISPKASDGGGAIKRLLRVFYENRDGCRLAGKRVCVPRGIVYIVFIITPDGPRVAAAAM